MLYAIIAHCAVSGNRKYVFKRIYFPLRLPCPILRCAGIANGMTNKSSRSSADAERRVARFSYGIGKSFFIHIF